MMGDLFVSLKEQLVAPSIQPSAEGVINDRLIIKWLKSICPSYFSAIARSWPPITYALTIVSIFHTRLAMKLLMISQVLDHMRVFR